MLFNFRLRQRITFFVERQLVKGAYYQLLSVAALIGLISIIGGALVLPSGEPTSTLGEAVWWAFLRLSDPGYLGDDQGNWRRFVSTIITILGYVVFLGSLVAIITSALNRKIRHLEQGLTPVAANNHIIILGWTNRTIHIAAEIFQSVGRLKSFLKLHGARSLQLIILADDVTPDHLQELRDYPQIGNRAEEIILRSGIAIDPEHLRRVDSLNASAIIIPSHTRSTSEFITPDIETIKTLLTLNAEKNRRPGGKTPFIVAEIKDESKLKAAYRAYTGELDVIVSNTIISRIIAQNIRHYGLSDVYNELLSRSVRNNLFVKQHHQAIGVEIAKVKTGFPKAIILGVVRPDGGEFKPYLNVPDNFTVQKDDRLVFLARNPVDIDLKTDFQDVPNIVSRGTLPILEQEEVTRILILGWNHQVPSLIKEFGTYEDENYHVVVASLRPVQARIKALEHIPLEPSRITVEHFETDFINEEELRKVNPANFDKIIFVSSDRILEEEEADARTIVGYVLLEDILQDLGKRPQILLELADPSNEMLLRRFKSELIISPMILSHLLAAVALRRELKSIYDELFTVGGAEIIFRDPAEYMLEGTVAFHELEKRAREYNETALGIYRDTAGADRSEALLLNPSRNQMLELSSDVRLVVLTTAY
jgi:hypothetical protein